MESPGLPIREERFKEKRSVGRNGVDFTPNMKLQRPFILPHLQAREIGHLAGTGYFLAMNHRKTIFLLYANSALRIVIRLRTVFHKADTRNSGRQVTYQVRWDFSTKLYFYSH
jgi:hypothetical protein